METNAMQSRGRPQPGRPREFDVDKALDQAIAVFSSRGFAATSIKDLTVTLKLTSGSLYKAYGDKRGLFLAALDRYIQRREARLSEQLADVRSGRQRVEAVLRAYAEDSHGERGHTGCMVVGSIVEFASWDAELGRRLSRRLDALEARLRRFIEEGREDGSIARSVDAPATARALVCLLQGMRVVGKTGQSKREMDEVALTALRLLD